ncbi:hypothetical protein Cgig2_021040 [Carnegiea gigantea]|uniref:Trichome birefringence-like N-terminal domain-containing protein n=1 Tax=Carnegiea gigantea TaxID=171969 RepID=A0A9Q1GUM9_9CARY|nr:hypothetical protein Cgig2_021040 [Carnegiea gigantea]
MKAVLPASVPVNQTVRKGRLSPFVFTLLAFIIFVAILYGQDYFSCSFSSNIINLDDHRLLKLSDELPFDNNPKPIIKSVELEERKEKEEGSESKSGDQKKGKKKKKKKEEKMLPFAVGKGEEGCDIFSGKWVRDEKNKPMYEEWECPYIQPQLTCQEHGRPDRDYQFWRWQPNSCDLPKFNATLMLETLRGKRMLFVGDSLNRGQYVSMICLLHRLVPEQGKVMESSYDSLTIFRLKDYNATIEFYWAPFLLESNSDNAVIHRVSDRIVRKGSINTHGKHWKGADIIVFNTYLWWMTGLKMKILKGSFKDEEKEIEELSTEEAYRMGMRSMLKWVERTMDLKKTRVFFTSMSPTHSKSVDWGGEPGGNCYNETSMIEDPNYWGSDSRKSIMNVIGEEFSKSKVPISFLNITQLSSYRKDAHTQIYKKQWSPLTPEQLANPKSYADCAALPASSPVLKKDRLFPFFFTLLALVVFVAILYGQDYFSFSFNNLHHDHHVLPPSDRDLPPSDDPKPPIKSVDFEATEEEEMGLTLASEPREEKETKKREKAVALPFAVGKGEEGCDIFSGKWVRDEKNKPNYQEAECPYIHPQITCQEHGRPDRDYQFWRWQPNSCDLPQFNASLMLEALRGKRMLFVGDSLNRGQFISMVCLLHRLVPENGKSMKSSLDSLTVFHLKDYNATIEFYWAPLLLESNSDNPTKHRVPHRIVRKNSINTHGKHWKGADIVVFNTYIWWMSGYKMRILKGSFKDEVQEIEEMSTEEAYRMAMKNMLKWVEKNMEPKKTRVFFTSMSPTHAKSIDWAGKPGGNCYGETTMIDDPNYWGSDCRKSIMRVIDEEFSQSKVPLSFLNITQLSNYRKDAHTQIYKKQWSPLTPEQLADPKSYADCLHWCLPGLQDTWNELLFAKLFYP